MMALMRRRNFEWEISKFSSFYLSVKLFNCENDCGFTLADVAQIHFLKIIWSRFLIPYKNYSLDFREIWKCILIYDKPVQRGIGRENEWITTILLQYQGLKADETVLTNINHAALWKWKVRSGDMIRFWEDKWLGENRFHSSLASKPMSLLLVAVLLALLFPLGIQQPL